MVKHFPQTSFMAWKSDMFFRNMVVFTTRSKLLPAAASTAEGIFRTRSV